LQVGSEQVIKTITIYLWAREVRKQGEAKEFLSGKEGLTPKSPKRSFGLRSKGVHPR
jgi:hypothetical protein